MLKQDIFQEWRIKSGNDVVFGNDILFPGG